MFRSILVGYDGSDHAEDALALAQVLGSAEGAKLTVAGVFPWSPWTTPGATATQHEVELARKVERAVAECGGEAETVPSNSPARGLHELAEELGVDLVVVGSSHRGRVGRALAGSVARGLLHGAPCAVAVAPSGFRERPRELRTIGVGLDGSPEAQMALKAAIELAERTSAQVRVYSVVDMVGIGNAWGYGYVSFMDTLREQLEEVLADAVAEIPDALRPESTLLHGRAASALVHAAEDLDLLFLGSRGYGPLMRVMVGSVSSELVEAAPCGVIVLARGSEEDRPSAARTEQTVGTA
jgi:nucleotide-binding universal stress UspA family protein